MIHLSGSILHLVIFLANEMKPLGDGSSVVEAISAAEGDFAHLLRMAPILVREMKT
jgi:hypothetical protein